MRSKIGKAWRVKIKPTGLLLQRHTPSNRGLVGVGRPNQRKMGNDAASHQMLNGLVRGAVLTQKDAVMG